MRAAVFFVLILVLSGCGNDRVVYHGRNAIGDPGWSYADSLRFSFEAPDTTQYYDLDLKVVHTPEYAWENAYVLILTEFPGDSVKQDILSLELAGPTGKWMGNCGSRSCALTIPLQQHLRFPFPGTYALVFVQNMRQEVVTGIQALELSLVRSEAVSH